MVFSRLYKYKDIYIDFLPIFVTSNAMVGVIIGSGTALNRDASTMGIFSNIIGYTSIGIITGMTYPISYPLFAGYVIYKSLK